MADDELEGDWVHGWPDRKRAELMPSRDPEGRVIMARSPVLDLVSHPVPWTQVCLMRRA